MFGIRANEEILDGLDISATVYLQKKPPKSWISKQNKLLKKH